VSLIDLIEKLINEHGSFKEHLELLKGQISILEKENSALKSENAILKGKEDTIESKLNKATKEIERLNEVIKVPKKDGEKPRLDAVTEKVLKLFFDTGQELSVNQVAGKLSINISTAQYHFDLLSEAKLIIQTTTGDKSSWTGESTPALFELTYSGRKYVIENKNVT
jgi:predicted nuclease with TOPRIM domain